MTQHFYRSVCCAYEGPSYAIFYRLLELLLGYRVFIVFNSDTTLKEHYRDLNIEMVLHWLIKIAL